MKNITSKLEWILKGLLALVLLAPILVSEKYFFPYITPKVVFFRWLVFASLILFSFIFYQKKEIIYKTTKIWWAFLSLSGAYFVSAIFGTFFEKSFWSNIERADGVVLMWYLFVYFALLVFAFRKKVEWKWLWRFALGICFYICGYGVLQHLGYIDILSSTGVRIASTFGNPAYLGNYALMNTFLALYMIVGDKNRKWLLFYIPSFLVSGWSVFLTQTRGSILGLVGGLGIAFLLAIFFSKYKKIK